MHGCCTAVPKDPGQFHSQLDGNSRPQVTSTGLVFTGLGPTRQQSLPCIGASIIKDKLLKKKSHSDYFSRQTISHLVGPVSSIILWPPSRREFPSPRCSLCLLPLLSEELESNFKPPAQIPLAAVCVTLSPLSSWVSPCVCFNSKQQHRLTQGADS